MIIIIDDDFDDYSDVNEDGDEDALTKWHLIFYIAILPMSHKMTLEVMLRPQLTYAVLAVWNWSLLQVSIVVIIIIINVVVIVITSSGR